MPNDVFARGVETDLEVRCHRCNRLLAEMVSRPWRIKCSRCKATNQAGVDESGR